MMRYLLFAALVLACTTVACNRDNNHDYNGTFCSEEIPFFKFTLVGNDGSNLIRGASAKFLPDSVQFRQIPSIHSFTGTPQLRPDSSHYTISHPQANTVEYELRLAPTGGIPKTFKVMATFSGPCYKKVDKLTVAGGTGCTNCPDIIQIKLPY